MSAAGLLGPYLVLKDDTDTSPENYPLESAATFAADLRQNQLQVKADSNGFPSGA